MDHKEFRKSLTFRFFNEAINVEFLKNKFDYIINSVNESHEHRYILRYNRIFYNIRGIINYAEIQIQGIPMTESILVVHAIVKNREQKLRTKIKCSFDEQEKQESIAKFKDEFIDKLISICTIGLNELPVELKIEICKYLNLISLVNLACSNRFWCDFILTDDVLWKHLYIRDFGSNHTVPEPNLNWITMYKNEYLKRRLIKSNENRWIYRSLPPLQTPLALPWAPLPLPWIPWHRRIDPINPINPLNPIEFMRPAYRRAFEDNINQFY